MTGRRRFIASPKRFAPLVAVALLALAAGVASGAGHVPPEHRTVAAFAAAWERGDRRAMYALLSDAARERTTPARLERTYREAADVMTLRRVRAAAREDTVAVTLETRLFGALTGRLRVPTGEREGQEPGVDWHAELVHPGLRRGEKLRRETTLPPRAALQARDGSVIAEGPDRRSELGPSAAGLVGKIGPAPPERAKELAARGIPAGAPVGLSGLEREFDERLTGTPGGVLYAGDRVLARKAPVQGESVRTSINPRVERAAIDALAGRVGGIAVVHPRSGEVLALAGIATSAPQPPGSVFKVLTLAAALEHGVTKRSETFPVTDRATIEGVDIQNAHGEFCGGSLRNSFAHSCNSVFAPLGAELGAQKLVEIAERFGFNRDPGLLGAARSTIPAADEIGDDLAVGSSAIGQGKVLTTPLEMALVTAAIAADGVRPRPTLLRGDDPQPTRVTPPAVARTVKSYMRSVVTDGTGRAAAMDRVKVAGKTGTAELRSTVREDPPPEVDAPPQDDTTDTNAWFVAFAPYREPEVAVAVLLVGQGAGGDTAAPAARVVLESVF